MIARLWLIAVLIAGPACAARPQDPQRTMPSPEGCFVQIWDAPRFTGMQDVINGPRGYANLRDLPGGRLWNDRIRSARVGPAATAMVWSDENFQGASLRLSANNEYPLLPQEFAGRIESMDIMCMGVAAAD